MRRWSCVHSITGVVHYRRSNMQLLTFQQRIVDSTGSIACALGMRWLFVTVLAGLLVKVL